MAKIQVTTESGTHTLYFGMTAVGIFQRKSAEEIIRVSAGEELTKDELVKRVDNMRSFAFCVMGGLANAEDIKENPGVHPSFEEAYLIADSMDEEQQKYVWESFQNSRAGSEILGKLPKGEKKKKAKTNYQQVTK